MLRRQTRLCVAALLWVAVCLVTGCTTVISHEATQDAYAEARETKGLAIVAVHWQRRWQGGGRWKKCGWLSSASIKRLAFTRLPVEPNGEGLDAVSLEAGDFGAGFRTHALLLEPGEYVLSSFTALPIHVWYPLTPCTGSECSQDTSSNPVNLIGVDDFTTAHSPALYGRVYGIRTPPPSPAECRYEDCSRYNKFECRYKDCSRYEKLIRSKAGSFKVKAGESVYIGNFWINCDHGAPMLWRYYTQKGSDFIHHMERVHRKYPFIDPARVVYRLFETDYLGDPYDPDAPSIPPEPLDVPPRSDARYLERQMPADRQSTQTAPPPNRNMQYLERETPPEK